MEKMIFKIDELISVAKDYVIMLEKYIYFLEGYQDYLIEKSGEKL